MADRYENGIEALRGHPVPDQWDEIVGRASTADDQPILLDAERWRRRPRWPLLAAAAVAAAVIGIAALMTRPSSTVSTEDPAGVGPGDGPATTEDPGTTVEPEPDASPGPAGTETPATEAEAPPEGQSGAPVAGCRDLQLASQGAPADIYPAQYEAEPEDPRLTSEAWPGLIGVFRSETNTQRAVFVVVGRGFGEGDGYQVEGPGTGWQSTIRSSSDGWVGEIDMTLNGRTCELSLLSVGLNEDEFVRFVQGVGHAH